MIRLGTWITIPHPSIIEIIAKQNFNWICTDLEHSPVSRIELQTSITIIQANGKKAFVRVSANTHNDIKFPLDAGADGIIIPMVNSATEAYEAVQHCLYPPFGRRGAGLSRAQDYGFGFSNHYEKNINNLEIFVQIEHIKAVEEIKQILEIKNITGVFVGPYDLSGSMGIPGDFENPKLKNAIDEVAIETKKAGKFLGIHIIKPEANELKKYAELGYNFLALSLDSYFLGQKIADEVDNFYKIL
ncbi:HpcH/HpaI aldolase family protein [Fluviispira sanaruensis]|uniref:2,4-dihydroxyhept-2-ene-1,7-dioic acid aldolase n=1 Tax=Fluviispira sanaruensis TaxID=2493639 RepID=A0A4P2VQ45_FLUSA|nr:aldolase/citrate lyase family protein [Fluviispira sanaruensis]BBH54069.1 2,4-dihydroxyhept-2-ene-1,7-dioic acid aldolase [Fluviispira sanaruensis]